MSLPEAASAVIANVSIDGHDAPVDITVTQGVIDGIVPAGPDPARGLGGRYAFSGFADIHVHLDKAHLLDRIDPSGGLDRAMAQVRQAKRRFTAADVQDRAARVLDAAIVHGTTLMRSYVEVDPDAGMRSWDAVTELRDAYAERVDLRLVPFAQDGTTNHPETLRLLDRALASGAAAVGGCSYADPDPLAHIRAILDLAQAHDVRADFHVDLDLDPSWDHLSLVLDETERRRLHGRVSVGHVTKLSAIQPGRRAALAARMHDLGVALVVLPATDLFLPARDVDVLRPRSVAPPLALDGGPAMAVATNNVCNPFTPFGNADVLRMANLYANVCQLAGDEATTAVWSMVTCAAEEIVGERRSLRVGSPATLVVLDAPDPLTALRELRQPVMGLRAGRPTFAWPRPELLGGAT